MSEVLPSFGKPQESTDPNSQQAEEQRQFSNPICQQTFVALPKIYGLKRGGRRSQKRTLYNERLFRPCCQKEHEGCAAVHGHHHSRKDHRPSIQELLKKHIKPDSRIPSLVRLPASKYSSLERNDGDRTFSREKSINNLSTKRKAVMLDESTVSMRGTFSQGEVSSAKNHRVLLDKIDKTHRRLDPIDHELSHKVFRRPMPPIGATMSGSSDNEIEISLKHIGQVRAMLLDQDSNSRKTIQTEPSASTKTLHGEAPSKEQEPNSHQQAMNEVSIQSQSSHEPKEEVSFNSRKHQKTYAAEQEEIEEEDENEEDNTIETPHKKVKRKNAAVQITETREAATQMNNMNNSRLNRTEISLSPDANTYFVELLKKQPFEKLRQSRCKSLKSSTTVEKYSVPTKSQVPAFIEHYRPMAAGFNLKELVKASNFGIVPYKNALYLGEFVEGQRQGKGVFISERILYEGEFHKGLKTNGVESTSEGVYRGSFANGYRQGHGEFRWFNQEVYIGEWKKGMKHGKGTWKSNNGSYYNGDWVENRQEGEGIHIHQGTVYRGHFLNFLKHGHGEEKFANGDQYTGEYFEGRCNGQGEYIWKNGTIYRGEFREGMKHGRGLLSDNEVIYEGCFQQDQKEGEGELTYRDGSKLRGTFHQNEFVRGWLTHLNGQQVEVGGDVL